MALTMMTPEFIAMMWGVVLYLTIGSLAFFGITSIFAIGEGCFIAIAATFNLFILLRAVGEKISANTLMIIPFIVGGLAFTRLTRYRWAARYPVAILSGVGAGVVFSNSVRAMIMNTIQTTVNGVLTGTPDPISAWVTFIPMIITPMAFTYSVKYSGWLHRGWGRNLFTLARVFFLIFVGGRMGELAAIYLGRYLPYGVMSYISRPIITVQDLLSGALELV